MMRINSSGAILRKQKLFTSNPIAENIANDNMDLLHNANLPRSRESTERAYLRFVNRTHTTVEIIWINFTGQCIRYQLLGPQSYSNIDTYKTHPWIAQDVFTKDRMLLGNEYIYQPQTTREHLVNNNPNLVFPVTPPDRRKLVYVTLPVHSLRYRTLLAIRNVFREPDGVDELELPSELKEDLKKVIRLRNRMLVNSALTLSAPVSL